MNINSNNITNHTSNSNNTIENTGSNYSNRVYWNWEETAKLIEILEEYKVKNFNSTNFLLSKEFWLETSNKLKIFGIEKNYFQCRVKWKNLKAQYKKNNSSLGPIQDKLKNLIEKGDDNVNSPPQLISIPNSPSIPPLLLESPQPSNGVILQSSPLKTLIGQDGITGDQIEQLKAELQAQIAQIQVQTQQSIEALKLENLELRTELQSTKKELNFLKREFVEFNELIISEQLKMNLVLKMLNVNKY